MRLRHSLALLAWAGAAAALIQCGSNATPPTSNPSPIARVSPTPGGTPTPTPTPSTGLPVGLTCSSPTPPPLLRMALKIHADENGRIVLDSKPLVVNVDHYCDKVGFGDWKFCDTRPEGDLERVACDYLATGKAEDTGRWGPTWFYKYDLCADFPQDCANHPTQQFMAIAKSKGTYEACAAEDRPVDKSGTRCGTIDIN
jgi:hypothetical protein